MTPIQYAFLKEGWIQVGGEDIPVFFRHVPTDEHYPFHVIFTIDSKAYYYLYNEWVEKGLVTVDKIPIPSLVVSAYEHLRCTPATFHTGILTWISDYYHHQSRTDHTNYKKHQTESYNYQKIAEYLKNKKSEQQSKEQYEKEMVKIMQLKPSNS